MKKADSTQRKAAAATTTQVGVARIRASDMDEGSRFLAVGCPRTWAGDALADPPPGGPPATRRVTAGRRSLLRWAGKDSNLRRQNRQIYSLLPLATWVPTRRRGRILPSAALLFLHANLRHCLRGRHAGSP